MNATGRIEAVVFDLLYTLVHPETYPGGTDREGWLAHLLGIEEADLQARWEMFEPSLEAGQVAASGNGLCPELDWVTAVAADLGVHVSDDHLAQIDAGWDLTRRAALLNPPPDTVRTLSALRERGIRLGLLSNTHPLELRSWHESPLSRFFEVTAFSYEIGACKPDPAAYATVLERLHISAPSAAYVGDGSFNELAGAKTAGFGLVVLAAEAPARSAPEELPRLRAQADVAVTSLRELVDRVSE
jgi:HAD superfamily hydrolase (TIGR01509 family)